MKHGRHAQVGRWLGLFVLALASCAQPSGSDGSAGETGETGDETSGDGDGDGDGGGTPGPPLYLSVSRRQGPSGLVDVQLADVSTPGALAQLEPLITPAPGEVIGSGVRSDRWAAFTVGAPGSFSLVLIDYANQPFGPPLAIDDVPAGALTLRMSDDGSLFGAVDTIESEPGPAYLIPLTDEPGPAQMLTELVEDIGFSPGGKHVWARLAQSGQARQIAVAPIIDGVAEPLVTVTDFPATEVGAYMPEAISETGAMYQVSYFDGFNSWAHYADVSAWPTVVETPLVAEEPGVLNRWTFASDTSAAIRLHAPVNAPDFQYDAELIRVVGGLVEPAQPFSVDPIDVHAAYISPNNRFAFFAQINVDLVDDLGVARLDGPNPTEVTPLTTAIYQVFGDPAVVFVGDWAVWRFGAGGLRAVWLGDEDVGPIIELLDSPEVPSSLSAAGSLALFRVENPLNPVWMIDLSGPTPSPPVPVTHELSDQETYLGPTAVSPFDDRVFYRTERADLGTESVWIRSLGTPDWVQELVVVGEAEGYSAGFSLIAPPG